MFLAEPEPMAFGSERLIEVSPILLRVQLQQELPQAAQRRSAFGSCFLCDRQPVFALQVAIGFDLM